MSVVSKQLQSEVVARYVARHVRMCVWVDRSWQRRSAVARYGRPREPHAAPVPLVGLLGRDGRAAAASVDVLHRL